MIDLTKSHSTSKFFAFAVGFFVLFIDQITKWLTVHYLAPIDSATYIYPYGGIGIFKNFLGIEFSINQMTNKGAAWGILSGYQIPLVYFRICLIGVLFFYFCLNKKNRFFQIPFMLIIAGALGNVIDYFLYGHVIDMLHFVLWGFDFPIFNVADSAISIGVFSLFMLSFFERKLSQATS
jgi:signal peptidase II